MIMKILKHIFVFVFTIFLVFLCGVSAFAMDDIALSVEEFLDCNIVPYMEFDFTVPDARYCYNSTDSRLQYIVGGRVDFDEERGLNLNAYPDDSVTSNWRYVPKMKWSSLDDDRVVFFRAKPANESSKLHVYIMDSKSATGQMFSMLVSSNGVTTGGTYSYLDSEFRPGLEWVDYLVDRTDSGVMYYAKSESQTGGEWKHIMTEVAPGKSTSDNSGLYFAGVCFVQKAVIYNTEVEEGVTSLTQVLGAPCSAVYDFSMDTEFVMQDGMTTNGTYSLTKDGLLLESGADWSFCSMSNWAPLSEMDAVFLRLKLNIAQDDSLTVRINDKNGLAKFAVTSTGVLVYGDRATSSTGVAKPKVSFSGTEWNDYLVKRNDKGGYSVYVKSGIGKNIWYLAAETKDYPGDSQKNLGVKISGSGTIGEVRHYTTGNTVLSDETLPSDCETIYYGEEFVTLPTEQSNLIFKNAKTEDGKLVLTAVGAQDDEYWIDNAGIPLGGYAEIRLKVGKNCKFITADGERKIAFSFDDKNDSLEGATTQKLYLGEDGNRYRVWRILRNINGTYTGFTRTDHENQWYQAFSDVVGVVDVENFGTGLFVQGGAEGEENNLICDYIKICGPTQNKRLLLTDGYSSKLATEDNPVEYFDCIRVMLNRKETEKQTLLFVEYINDALSGWYTKEVDAGIGVASIKYSAQNSAAKLKVFLWDSVKGMRPEAEASTSRIDWNKEGSVADLDGGFVLAPSSGEENVLWLEDAIDENFDVEWRMTIETFSGNEQVRFFTGTEEISLFFAENTLKCFTVNGEEEIPVEIGTKVHSYRLLKKDGRCYLYIDGIFKCELIGIPTSYEKPRIEFSVGGEI